MAFLSCIKLWFSILVSIITIIILQNLLPVLSNLNQNVSSLSTFINNSLGYCLILIPGYWLYKFAKKQDLGDNQLTSRLLKTLFGDKHDLEPEQPLSPSYNGPANFRKDIITFVYCFGGLQVSYLIWGVIQEKMMSENYGTNEASKFHDSQMLVFLNRGLSTVLSGIFLFMNEGIRSKKSPPLYKYSYCTVSNIISSWCQYESLKYVSFPTQVLAKTCKIIPVMLMGKLMSGKKYQYYEYVTAVGIWIGMAIFQFFTENKHSDITTCAAGVILLVGYLATDSFTSTWQGKMFTQYQVTSMQMVFANSLLSSLLTTIPLYQVGSFKKTYEFIKEYPAFLTDCIVLSVSSACGQLFIYKTISKFGPIVLTIIMTIRQGLSIVISCIRYHHPVGIMAALGIVFVFISVFVRCYCHFRIKSKKVPNHTTFKV
ncbi:adenosine 3'-phospho 5'-phosphosulfate transporter 1 [Rhopalosiphum padi]|uniref:adenosine 3'-phospho 5'-phosphosulfate transporter 1 n=1 Tax=Rhopalosiphum padi TaxID=40932 RepID=UPI00298E8223|nr:adenosine 3'-phospho 5'-phosphosulfate transporter 1 [Rhopalosiphum padi]XP_060851738.1 adenosine 3'-phospho 5'-phosphosulfate transporter 1 [Rhopalosiphum padi]